MSKEKVFDIISLVLNSAVIIMTGYVLIVLFVNPSGELVAQGFNAFKFFTVDSNVFAMFASIIYLPFLIIKMIKGEVKFHKVFMIIKFMSMTGVVLTMLTVLFFLGFIYGYPLMFGGVNLFMHLLTPLFVLLDFLIFDNLSEISFKETFFGIAPMTIYGIFYLSNVAINNGYGNTDYDWYMFGANGIWIGILIFILMFTGTYGVGFLVNFFRNKIKK